MAYIQENSLHSKNRYQHETFYGYMLSLFILSFFMVSGLSAFEVTNLDISYDFPAETEQMGGNWTVSKGIIYQNQLKEEPVRIVFGEKDWNNYSVQVKVKLENPSIDSEAGLNFHVQDVSDCLTFGLTQRKAGPFATLRYKCDKEKQNQFMRNLTGDQSWEKNLDWSKWHTLRADVHGAEITCFLDGKPSVNFWFMGTPPKYHAHGTIWSPDPEKGKVGLFATKCKAQFKDFEIKSISDFSHIITPQSGKYDKNGMLLPRQSYDETIRLQTEWIINSPQIVDLSQSAYAPATLPEPVWNLKPYLVAHFTTADDIFWAVEDFAFNSATNIISSIRYYHYSGDKRALEIAKTIADWHLENCTSTDWVFPYMSPGWLKWQPDGSYNASRWELDKTAYIGLAMLKLYAVTEEEKYLQHAENIAGMLRKHQKEDGSWPFRVEAKTGEILEDYACSQLWHVWFFENLSQFNSNAEDLQRSQKAFQWMLVGPVKDKEWTGLYGDYGNRGSYDQWVALETAMYLLERRDEFLGTTQIAENILDYVNQKLVVDYGFHPHVPGVVEQSSYKVTLGHHSLRLAEMYAMLYEATGKDDYKNKAIEIANSVTWLTMSDGKIRQGFWWHSVASFMGTLYNDQFCRIMSCIPESAPKNKNHLLANKSCLKTISYESNRITYDTIGPGEEILVICSKPRDILSGGKPLEQLSRWGYGKSGWFYDQLTGRLRIKHELPEVEINL